MKKFITILGVLFCLTALALTVSQAGEVSLEPATHTCLSEGTFLKDRLRTIFRTQLAGGALNVSGTDAWLEDYPLLATLSLKTHLIDSDMEFLQSAYSSIARYYNYLFIEKDTDGDFLIESADWSLDGRMHERVAFNGLLILDMESLARICLELGVPLRGLFWHDGTLLVRDRLAAICYDPDANGFYSVEPMTHEKRHLDGFLSLLPAMFGGPLGDNTGTAMIRRYLSDPVEPLLGAGAAGAGQSQPLLPVLLADQLKLVLLPEIIEQQRLFGEAAALRDELNQAWDALALKPPKGETYSDFLDCVRGRDDLHSYHRPLLVLELFEAIVAKKRLIKADDIKTLHASIETLDSFIRLYRRYMLDRQPAVDNLDRRAQDAIRRVYQAVSVASAKRKQGAIFSARDRQDIPGFDFDEAFSRLSDDVLKTLHRLESMVFNIQSLPEGLQLTGILLKERAVVGQTLTLKVTARANREQVTIRSLTVSRNSKVDTLLRQEAPSKLAPHSDPFIATHQFVVPSSWQPGLRPIEFTLDVVLDSGERRRLYLDRSVYIDPPVTFQVAFPEGRSLQDWGIPMDIQLTKKAPYQVVIQAGWYSPSGLRLREGDSQEIHMSQSLTRTGTRLHVLAPRPIRPGAFPFTIKLFANGLDIGTLSSEFFKHYQWVFAGPFPAGDNPMNQVHPPESHVNLLEGFDGVGRRIFWRMLPVQALADNGDIQLGEMLDPEGVGYLYTVIKSTRDMYCPAYISSSSPCALYINNRLVLSPGQASAYPTKSEVQLNEGLNNILIKVAGGQGTRVFFNLGENDNLTSDEFNNNLWELVDGFKDFYESRIQQFAESHSTQTIATLRYFDREANSVSVIGSFNGWSPENSQLLQKGEGVWEISLHLAPGKYAYRFLVNNSTQRLDPHCPVQEPDGYGGRNSVMYVE